MKAAWDEGVNFFDNAEAYEAGKSEEVMGAALKKLGWRRASYVVSTKIFFGMHDGVNERTTLNRKKLREGIDGALKRFGLDYIDLVFCHRPDPRDAHRGDRLVHAHDGGIRQGAVLGNLGVERGPAHGGVGAGGEAPPAQAADGAAAVQPLRAPPGGKGVRAPVRELGLGLTIWSPLAAGLLTGKYNAGVPKDSRLALKGYEGLLADPLQRGVPPAPEARLHSPPWSKR